ncbi:MFS transporter [Aeromonas salmonicida]|uniref:Major facilitator superfamily transport protein n=1 Tax=Aeromonas salmonicida subsp. pectinolytica 34mel TaxID=1324960 RepID=A0A2D1QB14_AERSA|nr:MFS transporter [Aeromonas salmonicida]MBP8051298.1 MFS transporter [Aeromonas sp.]ATP07589.1 major facilitator superfamily transport protein [Aeromonas salmonicida subsp. pectinolytica 34mel]ATU96350.1 MFS transporter [Aeromonas salmonicida]KTA84137.1 MFS transporter [Aeromonas salmonicida]MBP8159492.1 MFS transporter [Aeromonas sp.]
MTTVTQAYDHSRPLNRQDYKTLSLAALGGALEFYDFIIFVFFAVVIGELFFPADIPEWLRQFQTFGIFAAGYLARPLGGIIMAHFGDLIGRKRMFTLSILLMALPTLMIGLLPTYAVLGIGAPLALLGLRILQGAAIGGEVPGAWVFVAEHVPARRVGLACGTLTAGLTAGILLGSLIATAVNKNLTPAEVSEWGWRVPFLLGGIFGIVAMYLRRWLHETPVFAEMQANKALAEELPLKTVLRSHKGSVVISMLLTWLLSAGIVVVILMTPTYLQKVHGISPADALTANSLAILALTLGCIVYGRLIDALGSGPTFMLGSLLLAGSSYAFYHGLVAGTEQLVPLYMLAGFAVGIVGAVPYVMVNAFPAVVRFSGLSFSYNVAYAIFGGLTPMLVTLWMKNDVLAPSHYVVSLSALGFAIGLLLWLQQRNQRQTAPQAA